DLRRASGVPRAGMRLTFAPSCFLQADCAKHACARPAVRGRRFYKNQGLFVQRASPLLVVGPFDLLASAPEGRHSIARGVSPWVHAAEKGLEPRRGERSDLSPLRGSTNLHANPLQGLTPLAIECRPSGAK